MQIIVSTDFIFALHAIPIHESAVPLKVFKTTVTAKKSEIHLELKGSSAPKLNSTAAQTKKNNKKELWKNPLVVSAKNFLSNKPKYSQILSMTLHRQELTKLKQLRSRVQRKGIFCI